MCSSASRGARPATLLWLAAEHLRVAQKEHLHDSLWGKDKLMKQKLPERPVDV